MWGFGPMGSPSMVRLGEAMLPCADRSRPLPADIARFRAQIPPAQHPILTLLLCLLGPVALWAGILGLAALAASPELPPGQCSGIGWGCSLSPRDTVGLFGYLGGIMAVPIATIVLAIAASVGRPERRLGRVVALLGVFAVFPVGLVILLLPSLT